MKNLKFSANGKLVNPNSHNLLEKLPAEELKSLIEYCLHKEANEKQREIELAIKLIQAGK